MDNSKIYQDAWQTYPPTQEELKAACKELGTGSQVAVFLGLNPETGGRQVRRWIAGQAGLSFSSWFLLCLLIQEKKMGRLSFFPCQIGQKDL